jgi:hypothetical protein
VSEQRQQNIARFTASISLSFGSTGWNPIDLDLGHLRSAPARFATAG